MSKNLFLPKLIAFATLVLVVASSLRHGLFQTGALDLALFDQWVYLLSRDLPPISSFFGFHVLGDHAAFILYPVSLLYRLVPDIHWLFLIQAFSLTMGAIPIYALSVQLGLSPRDCKAMAFCYVLYPAIFNINFYADFRPETIAVPAMLWAVWAGTANKSKQLIAAVILILSCKDTLSLTVIALGLWFWLINHQRVYGWGCMIAGTLWFVFTICYLVPLLRNDQPGGIGFYSSLGGSLSNVAFKVLTNPSLLIERALMPDRLFYYLLLIVPVLLGLHWRQIGVLIPAIPMLLLNILSDYGSQRDLIHHYSLPIFPFILVWLVRSLSEYRQRKQRQWLNFHFLVGWSIIAFLALGKYEYFFSRYLTHLPNLASMYQTVEMVQSSDSVLAPSNFCPHLSHRTIIHEFSNTVYNPSQLKQYDSVILSLQYSDREENSDNVIKLKQELEKLPEFNVTYAENNVFLFSKHSSVN